MVWLQRDSQFLKNQTKSTNIHMKRVILFDCAILFLGIYPKEITRECMYNDVHLSIVYYSEKSETSGMPDNRDLAKLITFQTFN